MKRLTVLPEKSWRQFHHFMLESPAVITAVAAAMRAM